MSAPTHSDSTTPADFPKGRAKACTACRQVKLKCDARELFPAPCSRCRTQRLDCKMDSNFRRVPARRQLEEVSTQLNNLQRSLGLDQSSTAIFKVTQAANDPSSNLLPSYGIQWNLGSRPPMSPRRSSTGLSSNSLSPSEARGGFPNQWLMLDNPREEGSWAIGDLVIRADTVLTLFHHFDENLWQHIPILEPCTSLHMLYQSCAPLFWTIIYVACRDHALHQDIYEKLQPYVQGMLSSKIMNLPLSLKLLHAILLICVWPFPVISQPDDPGLMWCGVAINAAMMAGMHKPGHELEYGGPTRPLQGEVYTRKVTWLFIFQLSTSLSSWFGIAPVLSSTSHLDTVAQLCKDPIVPREVAARVEIQRLAARYVTTLEGQLDLRTKNSLIRLFAQDLDRTRTSFADVWSDYMEIELLGAKLLLFGLGFVSTNQGETEQTSMEAPESWTQDLLQHGLFVATRLLHTVRHLGVSDQAQSPIHGIPKEQVDAATYISQLVAYPKQFFRLIAVATSFLLWFLAVDIQASESDKELARNYVQATHRLFMSFTNSPEHIRFAKTIEVLGRMPNLVEKNVGIRVRSRLGASFMYDLIRNAVLYRQATRHTRDAQVPPPDQQQRLPVPVNDYGKDIYRKSPRGSMSESRDTAYDMHYSLPPTIGSAEDFDFSSSMPQGGVPHPDSVAWYRPDLSPHPFQDIMPNWEFPWGVWDDEVYDSLHREAYVSQIPTYSDDFSMHVEW